MLFADLKGSMELLADRDPEEARKLLDPVLERMMEAVHRYEGTVNQVMGDGIMALFGAPLAHEDHAVRACYAALRMQESVKRYAEGVCRAHGVHRPDPRRPELGRGGRARHRQRPAHGLHGDRPDDPSGRPDGADGGAGQHSPHAGDAELAEGFVEVKPLGPVPVKGLAEPVDVCELPGAGPVRTRLHAAAARGLTRFVGRDSELEQLLLALERAPGRPRLGRRAGRRARRRQVPPLLGVHPLPSRPGLAHLGVRLCLLAPRSAGDPLRRRDRVESASP